MGEGKRQGKRKEKPEKISINHSVVSQRYIGTRKQQIAHQFVFQVTRNISFPIPLCFLM